MSETIQPPVDHESSEPKLTRRQATEADTDFARRAHHEAFHDVIVKQFGSFDPAVQDEFFANNWHFSNHKILMIGDREAGYCSVNTSIRHKQIVVEEIVLLPEFQGQGIGTKILEEVLAEARANNFTVELSVLKENKKAQQLYQRLGFRKTEETKTHFEMEYRPDQGAV